MEFIDREELERMAPGLRGKPIDVNDHGMRSGVVSGVQTDDHGFKVLYVFNESLEETRIGGSWDHATVTRDGRELQVSVPYIGTASIWL